MPHTDYCPINYFIQQRCIKLIKSDSKDFYIVTKKISSSVFFWTLYSSKNPEEKVLKMHKIFKQHKHYFYEKCFLSIKSAY